MDKRCLALILGVLLFVFASFADEEASPLASRPVGVVRLSLPSHELKMFSMPFDPFDPSIQAVLGDQLTIGDRLLKWNALESRYEQAIRSQGKKANWVESFTNREPSTLNIIPGVGYWIENRQDYTQSVFLAGELICNASNQQYLLPQLNAVGYPYSSSISTECSAVSAHWPEQVEKPDRLGLAEGFWLNVTNNLPVLWVESRPYENIAAGVSDDLWIESLSAIENGWAVKLTIRRRRSVKSPLYIWTLDLGPQDTFSMHAQWQLTAQDIGTRRRIEWIDRDSIDHMFARYYLVSTASTLTDLHTLWEVSIPLTDDSLLTPSGTSLEAQWRFRPVGTSSDLRPPSSDLRPPSSALRPQSSSRIIYVDQRRGDDAFNGRAPVFARVGPPNSSGRPSSVGPHLGERPSSAGPDPASSGIDLAHGLPGTDQGPALQTNSTPVGPPNSSGSPSSVGPHLGERPSSAFSGPKKTIRTGLTSAQSGDTVIIKTGKYNENLNVAGRDVEVRIKGAVNLSDLGRPRNQNTVIAQTIEPVTNTFKNIRQKRR